MMFIPAESLLLGGGNYFTIHNNGRRGIVHIVYTKNYHGAFSSCLLSDFKLGTDTDKPGLPFGWSAHDEVHATLKPAYIKWESLNIIKI